MSKLTDFSRAPRASNGSPLGVFGTAITFCLATVAAVHMSRTGRAMVAAPFAPKVAAEAAVLAPSATAAPDAFGQSGNVNFKFTLPGRQVEFPLTITSAAESLNYAWVPVGDTTALGALRPLSADPLIAPIAPGFYRLSLSQGKTRQLLPEPTLAVMVPFEDKVAGELNGYRIGTYLSERFGHESHDRPAGFLEVRPRDLTLQVSKHLQLADFLTHDDQSNIWPKYIAMNPRLLDKLELIFADLPNSVRPGAVDVHSGFRTPSHNAQVHRSARDSRHQYGDAADLAIDVDGDGKITMKDELLLMLSVEHVEDAHPDLVGGLGVYVSRRFPTPYLHIDARGKRSRWKG